MRLYTTAQMNRADRLAVRSGVPSLKLMENAGRAAARLALRLIASRTTAATGSGSGPVPLPCGPVLILAGKGNNGGDGLVVARRLADRGLTVEVVLAAPADEFTGDAALNLRRLADRGAVPLRTWGPDMDAATLYTGLRRAALVIDALLGTGARGAPRGAVGAIIEGLAQATGAGDRPPVLAVDLPSGLDPDTGRVTGPAGAVRADATITFAGVKVGLAHPEAAPFTGRIYLADIGIPGACLAEAARPEAAAPVTTGAPAPDPVTMGTPTGSAVEVHWLLPAAAAGLLPGRPTTGHKGTFGHVWVVAGSPGFTGAAVLAASGALRAGAGLVTAACPAGSREIVAGSLPEALTLDLLAGSDGRLLPGSMTGLAQALAPHRAWRPAEAPSPGPALVVGPGMGVTPATRAALGVLLDGVSAPVVLDADALNALALDGPEAVAAGLGPVAGRAVVTPHPGEMSRLTGRPVAAIQADRIAVATNAARRWQVVVVLKGAGTVIAAPDGRAWLNATGNPGMATAGSGDVLAGAIGAFLAQGLDPLHAALAGVSVHGLAGDLAARDIGRRGLLASDIARRLPAAMDAAPAAEAYGPVILPVTDEGDVL